MNESLIRAGKEDLFRRGVDEIYLAMGIDRHHPLLEGVKHGLTLLKLGGYFVRLQPQQYASGREPGSGAQRADQRAEQDGQQHVPTAVGDLFVHFTQ